MHSFDDDKELDLLSKIAAEAIEAPSAANWEKMQRTLDKELPLQKKRRGGFVWWLFPGFLVAGLGYFWLNSATNSTNNAQTSKETLNNHTTNNKSTNTTIVESNKTIELNSDKTTEQFKTNTKKQIAFSSSIQINQAAVNKKITEVPHQQVQESLVAKELTTTEKTNKGTTIKEAAEKNSHTVVPEIKSENKETQTAEKNSSEQTNNSKNIVIVKKESNKNKGFFIGLTGGFDASTVKFKYSSNVGYNIGGTLGYRFNDHLSVQTGAVYTQKNYKLNGQDFHAPKGSWASYHEIETVDGYCKMWDVPIIATYHFTGNNNGNTFISIGSSSYFMKRENYNYVYDYNNQYFTRYSSINSNNQHLFALLHISAGIERPISKSITSIIEPYAKIPLAGVGFGSIQMSSFGLNFSVQYRQPKK